jgi:hypothetical protein
MNTRRRSNIVAGVILILLGVAFALTQIINFSTTQTWPFFVIGVGLLLFVLGAVLNVPDMAVPACIVGGIGGILFFMANHPGYWSAWAYAWTLIPAFVAVGMFIAWLMGAHDRYSIRSIVDTLLSSLVMFCIFAAIFIPIFRKPAISENVLKYWPLLLVAAGVIVFIRGLFQPSAKKVKVPPVPAVPVVPPVPEVPPIPSPEPATKKAENLEPIGIMEDTPAPVKAKKAQKEQK